MEYYIITNADGSLSFQSGGVPPKGAEKVSEKEWLTAQAKAQEVKPPSPTPENLTAYTADKRWRVETGGFALNGIPVATDDRSKIMIMGARLKAESDPSYVEQWKVGDGAHIDLPAQQLIAISNAVLDFVSACFATEAAVVEAIKAGKIKSFAAIDAYAWPGGAS